MIKIDPENNETNALLDMANFSEKHMLEIGCGDGRLTWHYADKAAHVTAIDPFEGSIARAQDNTPDSLKGRIEFRHIGFNEFAAANSSSQFDIAILSWSL